MSHRRRMRGAVLRRRHAEGAPEARREGADAAQPDRKADVGDGAVRRTEERRRTLESPLEEIAVRRRTEGATELAAEVPGREPRGPGECRHVERFAIARVHQVLGAQKMPSGVRDRHAQEYRSTRRWRGDGGRLQSPASPHVWGHRPRQAFEL